MTETERAQNFIIDQVLEPALMHPNASKDLKSAIANTKIWVERFKKVGDLYYYLDRFNRKYKSNKETYKALKSLRLKTFEDIISDFRNEFSEYILDVTDLSDFVIGDSYSSYDINIFARLYDNRTGGILRIGELGTHRAVFIKATLSGGKYPNKWLDEPDSLKYYLKSTNNKFNEKSPTNQSIIGYPYVPIYAFVRDTDKQKFILKGIYENKKTHRDDGRVWFELIRKPFANTPNAQPIERIYNELADEIEQSLQLSRSERLKRLKRAPKYPATKTVAVQVFIRNADVVAEVLDRAKAKCDVCNSEAPFLRRSNSTGYLEVHHKKPLSQGGEDTVDNAVALCPNCHRQEHFGQNPKWVYGE